MNMIDEFYRILRNKQIDTYYQPIVSLKDGQVIGYEALARGPVNSPFHSPQELFSYARKLNRVWELDLLCRLTAIERAKGIIGDRDLFINIDPNIIKDSAFRRGFTIEFLQKWGLSPRNIVFEITENTAVTDYKGFKEIIENYRGQGYRVALDDVGEGYSGLRLLAEIRPDFIKIDRQLIRDIDKDMIKRELLRSFQRFSEITNIQIVAEGIETREEMRCLMEIGVGIGQGFFIQRPSDGFVPLSGQVLKQIEKLNAVIGFNRRLHQAIPIKNIARRDTPLNVTEPCRQAYEIFLEKYNLQGITVVENNIPVGLIMRNRLYRHLARYENPEEFLVRPVTEIMDPHPLIVDAGAMINDVTAMAISREEKKVYDYLIVNKNNRYYGVVSIAQIIDFLNAQYIKQLEA